MLPMEINVLKKNKKWVAVIKIDGWSDTAIADRPGCAIRDVLNRFQYQFGDPSDDLMIEIEGW